MHSFKDEVFIVVKEYVPISVMALAFVTVVFSLFGEDSISRLSNLKTAIDNQQKENTDLHDRVTLLREQVVSLREDPRALEKAARNELGLSRPNEEIYIFEKKNRAHE